MKSSLLLRNWSMKRSDAYRFHVTAVTTSCSSHAITMKLSGIKKGTKAPKVVHMTCVQVSWNHMIAMCEKKRNALLFTDNLDKLFISCSWSNHPFESDLSNDSVDSFNWINPQSTTFSTFLWCFCVLSQVSRQANDSISIMKLQSLTIVCFRREL